MPLAPSGKAVKDGGWLAWDALTGRVLRRQGLQDRRLLLLRPGASTWTDACRDGRWASRPSRPTRARSASADGNGTIYATKGNNTSGFWKYTDGRLDLDPARRRAARPVQQEGQGRHRPGLRPGRHHRLRVPAEGLQVASSTATTSRPATWHDPGRRADRREGQVRQGLLAGLRRAEPEALRPQGQVPRAVHLLAGLADLEPDAAGHAAGQRPDRQEQEGQGRVGRRRAGRQQSTRSRAATPSTSTPRPRPRRPGPRERPSRRSARRARRSG